MDIDELQEWFQDEQQTGFRIDGLEKRAGNIPTGNGTEYTKNKFILTCSELLEKYNDVFSNPEPKKAQKGDLTAMLQYTTSIYCYKNGYQLKEFHRKKAILPNYARSEINLKMLEADVKKYDFEPNEELINRGFSVDTKKQLYRYPSMLLFNISILLSFTKSDSWETLDGLQLRGHISTTVYESLSFLLACSCYFRLSTYLFYDSQDDRLSVLDTTSSPNTYSDALPKIPVKAGKRWYLPQRLFNKYCNHSVPLKSHISEFGSKEKFFGVIKSQIPARSWLVEFQTYHYCNRWSESRDFLKEQVSKEVIESPDKIICEIKSECQGDLKKLWNSVKALTYSLRMVKKAEKALEYINAIRNIIENSSNPTDHKVQVQITADVQFETAESQYGLNKFDEAEKEFKSSLDSFQEYWALEPGIAYSSKGQDRLAMMHLRLGRCYRLMNQCGKAEKQIIEALGVYSGNLFPEIDKTTVLHWNTLADILELELPQYIESNVVLAHVLWTTGGLCSFNKYYQKTITYQTKSYKMFLELYGADACHKDITNNIVTLAITSDVMRKGNTFSKYWLTIATRYTQPIVGITWFLDLSFRMGWVESAGFHWVVMKVFKRLTSSKSPDLPTAFILNRFGLHLTYNEHYTYAETIYNYALNMLTDASIANGQLDAYIAVIYSSSALNTWKNRDVKTAEKLYEKALDSLKFESALCASLETAEILLSMGTMFESILEFERAEKCYFKAKYEQQCGSKDESHPQLVEIENRLQAVALKLVSGL